MANTESTRNKKAPAPRGDVLAQKIEQNPDRESAETRNAKPEADNVADNMRLDYSAGGIVNSTDIVTADAIPEKDDLKINPAESTRQKD